MDVSRPLGAGLFFYECLRILLLVVFLFIMPLGGGFPPENSFAGDSFASGAFFPYIVYLSSNALFPLMILFVWIRPEEYRNFLSLYMAGKIIAVVLFYVWEIFSHREFPGMENVARSIILWWGSILLSLADILSLLAAWTINKRFRKIMAPEGGGI